MQGCLQTRIYVTLDYLFNILTLAFAFIPATIVHLVPDTAGFRLYPGTDIDLVWFTTLQHIDRNSHTARTAQTKLIRDAGLGGSIEAAAQWTTRIRSTLRRLATLVFR